MKLWDNERTLFTWRDRVQLNPPPYCPVRYPYSDWPSNSRVPRFITCGMSISIVANITESNAVIELNPPNLLIASCA